MSWSQNMVAPTPNAEAAPPQSPKVEKMHTTDDSPLGGVGKSPDLPPTQGWTGGAAKPVESNPASDTSRGAWAQRPPVDQGAWRGQRQGMPQSSPLNTSGNTQGGQGKGGP